MTWTTGSAPAANRGTSDNSTGQSKLAVQFSGKHTLVVKPFNWTTVQAGRRYPSRDLARIGHRVCPSAI